MFQKTKKIWIKSFFYIIGVFTGITFLIGTVTVIAAWPSSPLGENLGGWLGQFFDLQNSGSGTLIVKGNIEAAEPTEKQHVATKAYVDASGGNGGSVIDPNNPGVGSASAGFDNHGGKFIAISTVKHSGDFGGKRNADLWCQSNVEGSDHMCNSWELNGINLNSTVWYQMTRIGDFSCFDKNGYRKNAEKDAYIDCYNWRENYSKGLLNYSCSSNYPVACCSDYTDSPEVVVLGDLRLRQKPQTPYVLMNWDIINGAIAYNIYRDGTLLGKVSANSATNTTTNLLTGSSFKELTGNYNTEHTFEVKAINSSGQESEDGIENKIKLVCSTISSTGKPDKLDNNCNGVVDEVSMQHNYYYINTPISIGSSYSCPLDPWNNTYSIVTFYSVHVAFHIFKGADYGCPSPSITMDSGFYYPSLPQNGTVLNRGNQVYPDVSQGCHQKVGISPRSYYYTTGQTSEISCYYGRSIYD